MIVRTAAISQRMLFSPFFCRNVCSGFGALITFDADSMCHMPISAKKVKMPSANALLLCDLL